MQSNIKQALQVACCITMYIVIVSIVTIIATVLGAIQRTTLNNIVINDNPSSALIVQANNMQVFGYKDFWGNVQGIFAATFGRHVVQFGSNFVKLVQTPNMTLSLQNLGKAYKVRVKTQIQDVVLANVVAKRNFDGVLERPRDSRVWPLVLNPFAGAYVQLLDSGSNKAIDGATVQVVIRNETVVADSLGAGLYYLPLPNDLVRNGVGLESVRIALRNTMDLLYSIDFDAICEQIQPLAQRTECMSVKFKFQEEVRGTLNYIVQSLKYIYPSHNELYNATSLMVHVSGPLVTEQHIFSVPVQDVSSINIIPLQVSSSLPISTNGLQCVNGRCTCGESRTASIQVSTGKPNGCGDSYNAKYWFIHKLGQALKYTKTCDEHDTCYSTCNNVQTTCDTTLCEQMENVCTTTLDSEQQILECMEVARTMCAAIRKVGSATFQNAQTQYCSCG